MGYSGLQKKGGGDPFSMWLAFRHPNHMSTGEKQLGTLGDTEELFGDSTWRDRIPLYLEPFTKTWLMSAACHLVSLNFLSFRSSLLKPQLDFDSLSGTPCLLSPSLAPFTSAWVSEVQVYISVRTALIDKYNENVSFLSGLHFITLGNNMPWNCTGQRQNTLVLKKKKRFISNIYLLIFY